MLGVAPETLDAVDVISPVFVRKCLGVIQPVMFAPSAQGIVTPESVSVVHRSFPGMLPDMSHEFIGGYPFHNFRIDSAVTLQKAKDNAFACGAASTPTLAPAAEVGLVYLNLSLELSGLQFRDMVDSLSDSVINSRNGLIINSLICGHPICRLELIEAGDDTDFFA